MWSPIGIIVIKSQNLNPCLVNDCVFLPLLPSKWVASVSSVLAFLDKSIAQTSNSRVGSPSTSPFIASVLCPVTTRCTDFTIYLIMMVLYGCLFIYLSQRKIKKCACAIQEKLVLVAFPIQNWMAVQVWFLWEPLLSHIIEAIRHNFININSLADPDCNATLQYSLKRWVRFRDVSKNFGGIPNTVYQVQVIPFWR